MSRGKVLCLHPYCSNGTAFRVAMGSKMIGLLEDPSHGPYELLFPNAPHEITQCEAEAIYPGKPMKGPFYRWWRAVKRHEDAEEREGTDRSNEAPAARPSAWTYEGLPETMTMLRALALHHGPFAGVVGHSQGACCALLFMALAWQTRTDADGTSAPQPLFQPNPFIMTFCGFPPRDATLINGNLSAALPTMPLPSLTVSYAQDPTFAHHPGGARGTHEALRALFTHDRVCESVLIPEKEEHRIPRDDPVVLEAMERVLSKL